MSWRHFKPIKKFHSSRSTTCLKASPTIQLNPERVNGSNPSFRRLSEGAYGSEDTIRELSPRPEPDSRTLTPELPPNIPNSEPKTSIPTPDSNSGILIQNFASKRLTPSTSNEELIKPEVELSGGSRDGKENIVNTLDVQLPKSRSTSGTGLPATLKSLQLAVIAMDSHGSGAVSPPSDGSINGIAQFMPDSTISEHQPASNQANFKRKTSKKISHSNVSEDSMEEPLNAYLPHLSGSNAESTIPSIQHVDSNHPVVIVPEPLQRTLDGHASFGAATKDFSHALGDCPSISEADESQADVRFPAKIEGLAKIMPGSPTVKNGQPLGVLEKWPSVDSSSPKSNPHGVSDITEVREAPLLAEASSLPPIPAVPGLPVDVTGLASAPATPASNLNKKQKMKVKGQRALRKGRRLILRKPVLSFILGRQLAGPTVDVLKLISEGGSGTIGSANSVAPITVPVPM